MSASAQTDRSEEAPAGASGGSQASRSNRRQQDPRPEDHDPRREHHDERPEQHDPLPALKERTRAKVALNTLLAGVVVLALLLVFILENTQRVKISYFGASGHLALGIALLIAAVGGSLLTSLVALARLVQVRHRIKRPRRSSRNR